MFESGDSEGVRRGWGGDSDTCVAGLIGVLTRDVRDENVGRARMVEAVCELAEIRMADAEQRYRDPADAYREVQCEVAAAMAVSLSVARTFVSTAERLHSMPLTAIRFVCGSLDWTRVVLLTSMLGKASDRTIKAIEHQAVAAAERFNPRSLRKRVWHLWMQFDREEATRAQKESAKLESKVRIDPKDNGMSALTAHMTDLQGAEAEQLISEIADTVCKKDPRSRQQLRVDGLIALLHGEHSLECTCSTGDDCPVAGAADAPTPRRGHLLQIMVDVETLLGLSSTPATLRDGTALDPEIVRILSEDARWQAILTELVSVLAASRGMSDGEEASASDEPPHDGETGDGESGDGESGDGESGDGESGDDGTGDGESGDGSTPPAGVDPSEPPMTLRRELGRCRTGSSAPLPGLSPCGFPRAGTLDTCDEAALSRDVARLLTAVRDDPSYCGLFPDGHGGVQLPPTSALVYRPTAKTAAVVRAAYRFCTFPGCEVPSDRCELDHIVPFDRRNPSAGGWTVPSNLQPLCKAHHQAKTARMWTAAVHTAGAIVWTSRSGLLRVTMPNFALHDFTKHDVTQHDLTQPARRRKRTTPPDPSTPTWWERNMPDGATPPTAAEQRNAETDAARRRIRRYRRRFREHRMIVALRERLRPPPF